MSINSIFPMLMQVTDCLAGFLLRKRPLDVPGFEIHLAVPGDPPAEGVTSVRLPPRSPNLNAYAERWVRSTKEECLDRMIIFGETMLRRTISEFVVHFHAERNHQGLDNKIIVPEPTVGTFEGDVVCRERLGGLLKYYHREPSAKAA